jgi:hypothetical protein
LRGNSSWQFISYSILSHSTEQNPTAQVPVYTVSRKKHVTMGNILYHKRRHAAIAVNISQRSPEAESIFITYKIEPILCILGLLKRCLSLKIFF